MKKILFFLLLLVSFETFAQKYLEPAVVASADRRRRIDSTQLGPTGCGQPWALSVSDKAQKHFGQYYDTCNKRFYLYDPKLDSWDTLHIGANDVGEWYNIKTRGGADSTGTIDCSSIIQAAINAGYKGILIPTGTFKVNTQIQMKDGVMIVGQGKNSIIKTTGTNNVFKCSISQGGNDVTFNNFSIKGTYSFVQYVLGTPTAQTGIFIDSATKVIIAGMRISGLSGYGIRMQYNGYCCGTYTQNVGRTNTVAGNFIDSCNIGIELGTRAEYNDISNNSITACDYGITCYGGNDHISNNSIVNNYYGLYIVQGSNGAHGTATGNQINHNQVCLYISGAAFGFSFINNTFGRKADGGLTVLELINSTNLVFIGGIAVSGDTVRTTNCVGTLFKDQSLLSADYKFITVSGTPPTVIRTGIVANSVSFKDVSANNQGDLSYTDKLFGFTRNGSTTDIKVGIGLVAPTEALHVIGSIRMVDGNEGVGKIMVSDANGKATWTAPTSFSLSNGSGTTASGSHIDLGGTMKTNAVIYGASLYSTGFSNHTQFSVSDAAGDNRFDMSSTGLQEIKLSSGVRATRQSYLIVRPDSILINPSLGNLFIDSLLQSASSSDSILVKTSGGQVKTRAQSAVGAITGSGLVAPVGTAKRLVSANTATDLTSDSAIYMITGGSPELILKVGSTTTFPRFTIWNTTAANGSGANLLLKNDLGNAFQLFMTGSTNTNSANNGIIYSSNASNIQIAYPAAGSLIIGRSIVPTTNVSTKFFPTGRVYMGTTPVDNGYQLEVAGTVNFTNTLAVGTSVASPLFNASTGFQIGGAATSRKLLIGNGTNFVQSTETYAVPGTAGNIMTSDGTNWTSTAPLFANTYNDQVGTTYTLQSSDNGKILTMNNGSAITLTVPAGLPAGFNCTVVQKGAGVVTFTASSTTINNRQAFTQTKGQYAAATIIMYATDTFITQGDMQ